MRNFRYAVVAGIVGTVETVGIVGTVGTVGTVGAVGTTVVLIMKFVVKIKIEIEFDKIKMNS
jgi:hypothetical protein